MSTNTLKRSLLASVAAFFFGDATIAHAQEAKAPVNAEPAKIEEIVVTAQKRSERLLDVPMSVSAVTGDQLAAANIGSTGNLQQVTPGLVTVNNGLAYNPGIRGVTSIGTSPGDETNVSLYLDDVYIGAPLAGLFDLKDIARVEVLKGPQGTLFGRNATGGAIRIVTKAPSFTPSADLSADYGFRFNQTKIGAFVTGPLSDKIAGSLDLFYDRDDGYVKGIGPLAGQKFGGVDNFTSRGKLLFDQIVPNLTVTLTADYSKRSDPSQFLLVPHDGQNAYRSTPGVVEPGPLQYSASTLPVIKVDRKSVV